MEQVFREPWHTVLDTMDRSTSFDTPEQAPPSMDGSLDEDDRDLLDQIVQEAIGVSGEAFTDTYEIDDDLEELEGNWWPSSDQLRAMQVPEDAPFTVPKPSEWVEDPGKIYLAVDRARREYWNQLKSEVNQIKLNVKTIPEIKESLAAGRAVDQALFEYLSCS